MHLLYDEDLITCSIKRYILSKALLMNCSKQCLIDIYSIIDIDRYSNGFSVDLAGIFKKNHNVCLQLHKKIKC